MDMEKLLEELKKDPKKLAKLAEGAKKGDLADLLKGHKIDIEPEKLAGLAKKLAGEGGDLLKGGEAGAKELLEKGSELLKGGEAKELLEKGEGLLKGILGGKK